MVFFLAVYGLLTYGFIFAAQQQLNYAAEEGARSALHWQGGRALALRAQQAVARAEQQAQWVGRMGGNPAQITVCGPDGRLSGTEADNAQADAQADPESDACSGARLQADQLEVMVRYGYRAFPLIPLLPGMQALVPVELSSRASARVGGAPDVPAES